MGVASRISDDNKTVTIMVQGRFDFSLHNEFRNAYQNLKLKGADYVVDLGKTDYVDSSALGMMLLLKEHATSSASTVRIVNVKKDIREILDIANFNKLFTIS